MNVAPRILEKIPGARRFFFHILRNSRFVTNARFVRNHLFSAIGSLPSAIFCGCLLILLSGCSGESPADLVIINGQEPGSLDPALVTGIEELRAVSCVFEGLTRNDPVTSRPIPNFAESWDISPDGKIYTFHMREKIAFSDGEPIDANDVVYSWLRVLDPKTASQYAGQLFYLKNGEAFNSGKIKDASKVGVHALDARTVKVELNAPTAFFLDLCAFQTLALVPRRAIEKYGDQWLRTSPVPCSGPYFVESWLINNKIRVRKNPYYWDAANTHCETIDLLPVTVPSTALNIYENGGADIIWDRERVPAELLDILRTRAEFHTFPYLGTYFLRFNVTKPPFNDARVRHALAQCIDKQRIIDKILRGGEAPASNLVPPGTANCEPVAGLKYDPAEARRLLAEAGYPGGKNFPAFRYLFDTTGVHGKVAVELQEMWEKELGIHAQLRQMEKKAYFLAQDSLDYDVSRSTWIGDYNDPNTFLDLFLSNNGNNRTGWKNAKYDELMHRANEEADLKKRADLLQKAETILVTDDSPIAPIYFYVGFNYFNPSNIGGIFPNILDTHPLNAIFKKSRGERRESRARDS